MSSDDSHSLHVDGYRNFVRIGTGGFSSVYRAEQESMGRQVAIKVLHTDLTTPEAMRTFERECRALGTLSRHPNIVTVYHDAVTRDDRRCIVMELCHGTVRELLTQEGPRPLGEVLSLGVKIGSALQHAHDEGILHRDIKPHNIFLSDYGEPSLGDFGISTIDVERSAELEAGLSLAYASPEALDDQRPTRATDIYALGITLFQLIDGETPFAAPRMEAMLSKIMKSPAPRLKRDDVPESLQELLHRCLEKQPTDRPERAADVVAALGAIESELGFERTPLPAQRLASPLVPSAPDSDAETVGDVGQAVEAARSATPSPSDVDSNPSLWPPGWTPWEVPDDETIVRHRRTGDEGSDSTTSSGAAVQNGAATGVFASRRRRSVVALSTAALVVALVLAAVLLR